MVSCFFPTGVAYQDWHGEGNFSLPEAVAVLMLNGFGGIVLAEGETAPGLVFEGGQWRVAP